MKLQKAGQRGKELVDSGRNGSEIKRAVPDNIGRLLPAGNQAVLQQMAQAGRTDTGIPGPLKERVENRSGLSLDDVKIHYHSEAPAKVGALAYTQGNHVYISPGQEKHLSHELGHVVQQKQGRVRPTGIVENKPLNDDQALEREADSYRQLDN